MTAAPYRVIDPDHWAFASTGLNQFASTGLNRGDRFGARSLHGHCEGGASGHETDKVSPGSPSNVHILVKATNPDQGGTGLITCDTPKGGAVFSAESIT